MLQLIWMCLIGLIVGGIAKIVMPGRDPGGLLITMLLGIAGSVVAGFLGRAIGWYDAGQGAGLIMSVLGAVLLLGLYRRMKAGTAR
ncbi:MAG: GlsB/YeaQ/YmgE family stress response membrane protein [Bryobacterales bacterium]|nr:GlsB/YeaQ/YmgE family stress response membrane protein [Bryobacterales bacterium]